MMDRLADTRVRPRARGQRENNFGRDKERGQRAVNGERRRQEGGGRREGWKERNEREKGFDISVAVHL